MNKLTDLEICKRIAEIEGVKFIVSSGKIAADAFQVHDLFSCAHMGFTFNPLTDDALCFKLMNKHEACVHYGSGDVFICGGDNFDGCLSLQSFDVDDKKTLNKAICLAIIEAHKND